MRDVSPNPINIFNYCPSQLNFDRFEEELNKIDGAVQGAASLLHEFINGFDPDNPTEELSLRDSYHRFCVLLGTNEYSDEHPFIKAVEKDDQRIVNLFLSFQDRGFDINCTNRDGKTAAHKAAILGKVHLLDSLKEKGLDLEATDIFLNTPLHCAVMGNKDSSVKWLVANKIALSTFNQGFYTPLQLAEKGGLNNIANTLKNAGATQIVE